MYQYINPTITCHSQMGDLMLSSIKATKICILIVVYLTEKEQIHHFTGKDGENKLFKIKAKNRRGTILGTAH